MPPSAANTQSSEPTVSILSTAFNEEQHVGAMIKSVLRQTYENWELLCIDDGSTDRTASLLKEAALMDPRIKLVSSGSKLGKVGAFNALFKASKGDVIALMGADDLLPINSTSLRARIFADARTNQKAVAYFKLLSFSDDPKFRNMVLPRGQSGSRSGPSITMNRLLAQEVFPIPSELVSEDTWLGEATAALADVTKHSTDIVVHYRIHSGNSNPRHKSFREMDLAMHKRAAAWPALRHCDRFELPTPANKRLKQLEFAESLRHSHKPLAILRQTSLPLFDRLAFASMSHPGLFAMRTRFYRFFSGRRGM